MLIIFYLCLYIQGVYSFWENEKHCPISCTCRLQHITETTAYRYTEQNKEVDKHHSEANIHENNDVFYDEDFATNYEQDKTFLKTAICIIQTEMDVQTLIQNLPKDLNALTLIQGSDSGNKTIKLSYLLEFNYLTVLELQGVIKKEKNNVSKLICEIDVALPLLEYFNSEKVELENSRKRLGFLDNEVGEFAEEKLNPMTKPLVFLRGSPIEILPYNKYLEEKFVSFKDFSALRLLRISNCDFNNLHWEMFEGLNNLIYLILEKNNLKFVPDFAFFGTANIKTLSLAHNNLLNIQIRNLAGLLELEYLDLSHNNFSQLSELSLPPFPKLKLANFGDNPISAIFPNTFEVMNTTDSIILGGVDMPLTLLTNSFLGLKLLKKLTIRNLKMVTLEKEIFVGMPNVKELVLTGDIPKIEFDAFLEIFNLESLILNNCNISKISVDGFMGLKKLKILDLSRNNLEYLPQGIFDLMTNLNELYLNNNNFKDLPKGLFVNVQLRLLRLNNNPWHCSCVMSEWKPMIINKIKQKTMNDCTQMYDKGLGCAEENGVTFKYLYDNKIAPKCSYPKKYENWNVFHVLRKQLKCSDFRLRIKKQRQMLRNEKMRKLKIVTTQSTVQDVKSTTEKIIPTTIEMETTKMENYGNINNDAKIIKGPDDEFYLKNPILHQLKQLEMMQPNNFDNNLDSMRDFIENPRKPMRRKYRKKMYRQNVYGKIKKVDM